MRAAARQAGARIAELEAEVSRLEGALAKATRAAPAKTPRAAATRPRKQSRELDPGDAVPPGVAVQEPAPAWCRDQGCGCTDPSPVRGQATRT